MDKRAVCYIAAGTLPVSILFISIIFASSSFMQDGHIASCGSYESTSGELYTTHFLGAMKETKRLEMLGLYIRNQLRTAGYSQLLPFYMPEIRAPKPYVRTPFGRRMVNKVRIRPASAHALWRRVHKEDVFMWPVDPASFWISSYFGPRTLQGSKGFHRGIDMAAAHGTPVIAAADGYVKEARYAPGYGNCILLVHPKTFKTRYAHLSKICVRKGQRVRAGQLIGKVGATGKVTKSKWGTSASHLHFEVYRSGKRVNPFRFLA